MIFDTVILFQPCLFLIKRLIHSKYILAANDSILIDVPKAEGRQSPYPKAWCHNRLYQHLILLHLKLITYFRVSFKEETIVVCKRYIIEVRVVEILQKALFHKVSLSQWKFRLFYWLIVLNEAAHAVVHRSRNAWYKAIIYIWKVFNNIWVAWKIRVLFDSWLYRLTEELPRAFHYIEFLYLKPIRTLFDVRVWWTQIVLCIFKPIYNLCLIVDRA